MDKTAYETLKGLAQQYDGLRSRFDTFCTLGKVALNATSGFQAEADSGRLLVDCCGLRFEFDFRAGLARNGDPIGIVSCYVDNPKVEPARRLVQTFSFATDGAIREFRHAENGQAEAVDSGAGPHYLVCACIVAALTES